MGSQYCESVAKIPRGDSSFLTPTMTPSRSAMWPKTPAAETASALPCCSRMRPAVSTLKKACSVGMPCSLAMRTGSPDGSTPRNFTPNGT
jgi:hypothetical protein